MPTRDRPLPEPSPQEKKNKENEYIKQLIASMRDRVAKPLQDVTTLAETANNAAGTAGIQRHLEQLLTRAQNSRVATPTTLPIVTGKHPVGV